MTMPSPDGSKWMHGELKMLGSNIYIADSFPEMGGAKPPSEEEQAVSMHVYVEDVDAAFAKAVEAGATVKMPPTDMFWGDRFSKLRDPYGHTWSLATHIADPTPEEMAEAMKAMMSGDGCN